MTDEKEFQGRIQRISGLVNEMDAIADPAVRATAKDMVQLLLDLYGTGLDKMLEIVASAGDPGLRIIGQMGRDSLVSSLLVLHGLHPEDFDTRVRRAMDQVTPRLRKQGCEVELLSVAQGMVRLRMTLDKHGCGSTAESFRVMAEEALYAAAPDMTSFVVEGLETPPSAGFFALEKLTAAPASASVSAD